jgi:Glycosyltransferase family 87
LLIRTPRAYRLLVPGAALLLYGMLAGLWLCGPRAVYFGILKLFGFEPFRFPFLDIQVVLAAGECWRHGYDVYLSNPCDALDRPLGYSPLWLRVVPGFLTTGATAAVGLGLGLLFIASLPALCRPAARDETLLLGLTVLSPMIVYALERANADVALFLLILAGCALCRSAAPWPRFGGYALFFFAGLLKFYPLLLLALILRERRRDVVAAGAIGGSVLLLLAWRFHSELAKALANLPTPSYFADAFSAMNLPFGLSEVMYPVPDSHAIGVLLFAILIALTAARIRRTLRQLDPGIFDGRSFEADCLIVGALLLVGCFFAGRNIDYRGIYFVLAMPGLLSLRRATASVDTRRFLTRIAAAVVLVTWEEFFRHMLYAAADKISVAGSGPRLELLFWLGGELLWWWLIAGLAAIVFCYIQQLPFVSDAMAALPKRRRLRQQSPA